MDDSLQISRQWKIHSAEINYVLNGVDHRLRLERKEPDNWLMNGQPLPALSGYTDMDIAITLFTNMLPINYLQIPVGTHSEIQVVYIDFLKNDIRSSPQQYTRLSEDDYQYQNVPNNFEAIRTVDKSGFVRSCPESFTGKVLYNQADT